MISPWTKPGTKVVVIATTDGVLPVLHKGLVVEIDKMVENDTPNSPRYGEIGVRIKGIDHNRLYPHPRWRWWSMKFPKFAHFHYCRENFAPLDEAKCDSALPESITRYLTDPIPSDLRKKEAQ